MTTHGLSRVGQHHPLYSVWDGMKRRCHGNKERKRYGARGIYVCRRWLHGENGKTGLECFISDMGERPEGFWLERKDNDGPYSPANCRWATPTEQQRNKSSNRLIEFNGRQMTVTEAIGLSGLKEGTVWARITKGWTVQDALTRPLTWRGQCAD